MTRPAPDAVSTAACVGTGTIGSGRIALFLAHGMDVVATDPGDNAEAVLRGIVRMEGQRILRPLHIDTGRVVRTRQMQCPDMQEHQTCKHERQQIVQ